MRAGARWLGATVLVAMAFVATPAAAQSNGDPVRIETNAGVVEGTLIDKLPDGYLVRVGETTQVVKYGEVKSIAAVVPEVTPVPATPPPAEPAPPSPSPSPSSPPPPPAAPVYAPPQKQQRSPGLVAGGAVVVTFGTLGLLTGAVMFPLGLAISSSNECRSADGTKTFDCEYGNTSDLALAGGIVLGAGVAMLVGGIVMIVVGNTQVPRRVGTLAWSF